MNKLFRAGPHTHTHTHHHHSSHDTRGKTQVHRGHGNAEHTHSTLRRNLTTNQGNGAQQSSVPRVAGGTPQATTPTPGAGRRPTQSHSGTSRPKAPQAHHMRGTGRRQHPQRHNQCTHHSGHPRHVHHCTSRTHLLKVHVFNWVKERPSVRPTLHKISPQDRTHARSRHAHERRHESRHAITRKTNRAPHSTNNHQSGSRSFVLSLSLLSTMVG